MQLRRTCTRRQFAHFGFALVARTRLPSGRLGIAASSLPRLFSFPACDVTVGPLGPGCPVAINCGGRELSLQHLAELRLDRTYDCVQFLACLKAQVFWQQLPIIEDIVKSTCIEINTDNITCITFALSHSIIHQMFDNFWFLRNLSWNQSKVGCFLKEGSKTSRTFTDDLCCSWAFWSLVHRVMQATLKHCGFFAATFQFQGERRGWSREGCFGFYWKESL